jgi:hypothetical protein
MTHYKMRHHNDMYVGVVVGPTTPPNTIFDCVVSLTNQKVENNRKIAIHLIGDIRVINEAIGEYDFTQFEHIEYCFSDDFNENMKKAWITAKKNLIVDEAHLAGFQKICIVHDYYYFDPDWYQNLIDWWDDNEHYQLVLNPIYTAEGTRHSDWLLDQRFVQALLNDHSYFIDVLMKVAPHENHPKYVCGLPYEEKDMTNMQYISGGYICGKTEVLKALPLDETRCWGDEEDLEWSQRVRGARIKLGFCPNATVRLTKPGKWHLHQLPDSAIRQLKLMFNPIPVLKGNDYS